MLILFSDLLKSYCLPVAIRFQFTRDVCLCRRERFLQRGPSASTDRPGGWGRLVVMGWGAQNPLRLGSCRAFKFFSCTSILCECARWWESKSLFLKEFRLLCLIFLVSHGQHSDSVCLHIMQHSSLCWSVYLYLFYNSSLSLFLKKLKKIEA